MAALSKTKWLCKNNVCTTSRQELLTAFPNIFHHGSPISMSHTLSFVYHLPLGRNQSSYSHPGCLSILKNSPMSLHGTWREGCGGDGGKECVFSADRCVVQCADRALNSDLMYGFRGCLHTHHWVFHSTLTSHQQPHKQIHPKLTFSSACSFLSF